MNINKASKYLTNKFDVVKKENFDAVPTCTIEELVDLGFSTGQANLLIDYFMRHRLLARLGDKFEIKYGTLDLGEI